MSKPIKTSLIRTQQPARMSGRTNQPITVKALQKRAPPPPNTVNNTYGVRYLSGWDPQKELRLPSGQHNPALWLLSTRVSWGTKSGSRSGRQQYGNGGRFEKGGGGARWLLKNHSDYLPYPRGSTEPSRLTGLVVKQTQWFKLSYSAAPGVMCKHKMYISWSTIKTELLLNYYY